MWDKERNLPDDVTGLVFLRQRFKDLADLEGRQRQTEEALRSSEMLFRLLVDEVVDYGIVMLDAHGLVVSWNSGAERMEGYRADEILGKHFSVFHPHEDLSAGKPDKLLAAALTEGRTEDEGWRVRKDGSTFWANVVVTAMHNQAGDVIGFSKVTKDLTERKLLGEKILDEKKRLQTILDRSPSIIFLKDKDGRYLLVNAQFESQFGLTAASIVGRTDAEVFPPDQAAKFMENDRCVRESGKPLEFEEEAVYSDGPHTSIVVKYPLFDSEGTLVALGGIVTDISRRKRAEEALRASERVLRELVDALPTAVYVCDSSGLIESFNKRAAELWGREPRCDNVAERFCGSHKIYRVDGTFLPHPECPMAQVLQTGRPLSNQEIVIERPDGSRRKVMVNIVPRRNERGVMTGAINCLTDITEMTLAEARFKGLLEAAPDAMVITDLEGRIQIVNSQTERMFGYGRLELYGKNIEILVPARFREKHPGHRGTYARNPKTRTMGKGLDLFALRKDGTEFPVDISLSPFDADGGQLVIAAVRDITERKKSETELQDSHNRLRALTARLETVREEEKGHLALEIHDELGQILTAVKMDLGQLRHELHSRKTVVRSEVERELGAAFSHIDESIDTVRNIAFDLKPGLLNHFGLKEAIKDYVKSFEARSRISCTFVSSGGALGLSPDHSTALFRVLQEAMTNVARHSGASKVRVVLEKKRNLLVLEIRDTGKGIPDSKIGDATAFGILGMKERATMLGGSLSVLRGKRRGTVVRLSVPCSVDGRMNPARKATKVKERHEKG